MIKDVKLAPGFDARRLLLGLGQSVRCEHTENGDAAQAVALCALVKILLPASGHKMRAVNPEGS
jgi:hypothetical protein